MKRFLQASLLALILLAASSPDMQAEPWVARHGMTSAKYQSEFNKFANKGYRLTRISGYTVNGQVRYAAVWEKKSGPAWVARHGMTSAKYQSEFNKFARQGYRLTYVSGYAVGSQVRYAAIWEKKSGPAWVARHGMTSAKYQSEFNKFARQGYRLTHVSGYAANGQARYAAIWEKKSGPAWAARHGMTSAKYQSEFNKFARQGYRLTHVSGYAVGGQARYAAIWEKKSGPAWAARHGMSSSSYQTEFDNHYYQGYRLRHVSAFSVKGKAQFAAIWENQGFTYSDLQHINTTIGDFMKKYDVPGVSIGLVKDGRLVFAKGYGYANQAKKEKVNTRHLFRIASVSKPITAVAIMKLVEQGKLSLNDKVFGAGGVLGTQYGSRPYSSKVKKITIKHLLEHTAGGWSNSSNDPMFQKPGYNHTQLIGWVLDNRPLDTTPGTAYAYSNFGYCVLGRVIEKVTGQSYAAYVKNAVLKPAGVKDMHIGGDTKAQKRANEVIYYQPNGNPYGMKVKRMDAHGGWIASPIDLLRMVVRVDGFATKKDHLKGSTINTMTTASRANPNYAKGWLVNNANNWWHNGSLPGTGSIMVRANNGLSWVVLVNTRDGGNYFSDMDSMMWDVVNGISSWPSHDLF